MPKRETILKVGAELGSITLFGIRTKQGWRYLREVRDYSLSEFESDEEEICHESVSSSSWEEALELLDCYPWARLYPLEVHSEFRQDVWAAVQRRSSDNAPSHCVERWRELLEVAP